MTIMLEHGGVAVVFTRRNDRWVHHLAVAEAGRPVWHSLDSLSEGSDPCWPSPPFAEMSEVLTPAGRAIVGLGRAGQSHFSASIHPDPRYPEAVRFELACRTALPAAQVGSTYVSTTTASMPSLMAEPADDATTVVMDDGLAWRMGRMVRFLPPAITPEAPGARTIAWAYRVWATEPAG